MFDTISRGFKSLGFRFVAIDVDGYRTGALNEALTQITKNSGRATTE
jgi:PP-loop superfamily ATP-utilizing enzyme